MIILNWILEDMIWRCRLGWCSAIVPVSKVMNVLYRCGVSWRVSVTWCGVKSGRTLVNLSCAVLWSQTVRSWIRYVMWCEVRPYAREFVTWCGVKSGRTLVNLSRAVVWSQTVRSWIRHVMWCEVRLYARESVEVFSLFPAGTQRFSLKQGRQRSAR